MIMEVTYVKLCTQPTPLKVRSSFQKVTEKGAFTHENAY
jgi:hypothetical protein